MRTLLKVMAALVVLAAAGLGIDRRLHLPPTPPSPAEIKALEAERDRLQAQMIQKVVDSGEVSLAQAPRADLVIGLPTSLMRNVVNQVVTGLFGGTTLTLRGLKVAKDGKVDTKLLFTKKTIGRYELDIAIQEVQGLLRPGTPDLTFGQNKIKVALPVSLAEGHGHAEIHLKWDSRGLAANAVCGDEDTTRAVTGGVKPQDYRIVGEFGLEAEGDTVILRPDFGDLAVRIFVVPTDQAWGAVDAVVAAQRAGCRAALSKLNIKGILERLLGKGFNVKIPRKIMRPVRLPARVQGSLDVQGVKLNLEVTPAGLLVAQDRLWYGADLTLHRGEKAEEPRKTGAGKKNAVGKKNAEPRKKAEGKKNAEGKK